MIGASLFEVVVASLINVNDYASFYIDYGLVPMENFNYLLPVSVAVNGVATIAIATRFWLHLRVTKAFHRTKRSSVEKVFIILVDSGIIYCIIQAVYPLLVIVLVSEDRTVIESFGFSAVGKSNIEAGVSNSQRPATIGHLSFGSRSTTTVLDPSDSSQSQGRPSSIQSVQR
ncbi:hypothetical protein H0H92_013740 [Tricholoma furcatifolium]|nr:hypothetical protein H0H92_013740 [Tricholoma furcatifolium]